MNVVLILVVAMPIVSPTIDGYICMAGGEHILIVSLSVYGLMLWSGVWVWNEST